MALLLTQGFRLYSALLLGCAWCVHGLVALNKMKGVVFGEGVWSAPHIHFTHPASDQSLQALASTGADWVRLMPTYYVSTINSTSIFAVTEPFSYAHAALRTATDNEVIHAIEKAHSLHLNVLFSVVVDPDWTVTGNCQGPSCSENTNVSREVIGCACSDGECSNHFSTSQWKMFFSSYMTILEHYLRDVFPKVMSGPPKMLSVGSGLSCAAHNAQLEWQSLLSKVKSLYSGMITYEADLPTLQANLDWLNHLDLLGVEAFFPLDGENVPSAPTVDQLVQRWHEITDQLENVSKHYNKTILFTAVGYQSRFACHKAPGHIMTLDPTDGSCWERSVDLAAQRNAYQALFEAVWEEDWLDGMFIWLWRNDPSHGGTSDDGFMPRGKPAEDVIRLFYGSQQSKSHVILSNNTASILSTAIRFPPEYRPAIAAQKTNGMCFGLGEWTVPSVAPNSTDAVDSLNSLKALGANAVRILITWFVDNDVNATSVWPANGSSPLALGSDDQLAELTRLAHQLGLKVQYAPYIDPDFDNPANCRGPSCGLIPGTTAKAGRGKVGKSFNSTQWELFFKSYGDYIMHYVKLAEELNVEEFCVGAELFTAFSYSPDPWLSLIDQIRRVYHGRLTAAINSGQAVKKPYLPWLTKLDFIGVEGYFLLEATSTGSHPGSPPVSVDTLLKAWQEHVVELESLHIATNKPIVFTEVGYQSRANSHQGPSSTNASNPTDCSVLMQCVQLDEQSNAYEALFEALYGKPWFSGVHWWLWRSDPTSGGTSDYSFSPHGKPAQEILRAWYTGKHPAQGIS